MSDQLDDVRQRLAGLWTVGGMEVYWMLPKQAQPSAYVHALGNGTFAMCGHSMQGMWSRRRWVSGELQCPACVAYLQEHGVLR